MKISYISYLFKVLKSQDLHENIEFLAIELHHFNFYRLSQWMLKLNRRKFSQRVNAILSCWAWHVNKDINLEGDLRIGMHFFLPVAVT